MFSFRAITNVGRLNARAFKILPRVVQYKILSTRVYALLYKYRRRHACFSLVSLSLGL